MSWHPPLLSKFGESGKKGRGTHRPFTFKALTTSRLRKGRYVEFRATRFLQARGLRILERNYYGPSGEVDIIAIDRDELVFVEVRFLADTRFHQPEGTITRVKKRKIRETARYYLAHHRVKRPYRFDIVAVTRRPYRPWLTFRWLKRAFK